MKISEQERRRQDREAAEHEAWKRERAMIVAAGIARGERAYTCCSWGRLWLIDKWKDDGSGRCKGSFECSLAYRHDLSDRQRGLCTWCLEPLGGLLPVDRKTRMFAYDPATKRWVRSAWLAIDHIIPTSWGGPDKDWNRQLLHFGCNSQKGRKLIPAALELAAEYDVEIRDRRPSTKRKQQIAAAQAAS